MGGPVIKSANLPHSDMSTNITAVQSSRECFSCPMDFKDFNLRGTQQLAGVSIVMDMDFAGGPLLPHGENAQELELMVQAGMTPMEAIIISTAQISAKGLGMGDRIGTIEKGKFADILVLDANPLNEISVLQSIDKIKMVIKAGDILINKEAPLNQCSNIY